MKRVRKLINIFKALAELRKVARGKGGKGQIIQPIFQIHIIAHLWHPRTILWQK